jgi:ectoine hydroxylase-related dioxygenase (phytanoyl-CoA dioxygenase family)
MSHAAACPAAIIPALGEADLAHFRREGYAILHGFLPPEVLAAVRADCDAEVARQDAEMTARGVAVDGINHNGKRYFIPNSHDRHDTMRSWVFSPRMAGLVRAVLGDEAQLFLEQFVVKGCDAGSRFGWHQDSGYVGYAHREYLSCWIALDDVDERNGTISVLPWTRAGADPRAVRAHAKEDGTNDMVGYDGPDPGLPVVVPAGTVVAFSSRLLHRSGPNQTDRLRRAWLVQYTAEPMYRPDGQLQIRATPFLSAGEIVA